MNAWLIALGILGLLCGVGAFWVANHAVAQQSKIPSPSLALLVGWSFLGCGLVSWRARPDNRLGPVMVLTGFAWFASVLQEGNSAVVATIGGAFAVLYLAGFLYVGLSFPSGRLPTMLDRARAVTAWQRWSSASASRWPCSSTTRRCRTTPSSSSRSAPRPG